MRGGRSLLLGLALVVHMLASVASGQNFPPTETINPYAGLGISLEPIVILPRSGGPSLIEWRCQWTGSGTQPGLIRFEVYDGMRLLGTFHTGEIVVTRERQRFRQLLPPMNSSNNFAQVDLHAHFIGRHGVHRLQNQALRVPSRQLTFVIATCDVFDVSPCRVTTEVERALNLELFDPKRQEPGQRWIDRPLTTTTAQLTPAELPADSLSYCAFDIVVLGADGLEKLRESQLKALTAWVQAGGSLCVIIPKKLSARRTAFLDELFGTGPDDHLGIPPGIQQIESKTKGADRLTLCGLGRVGVLRGDFPRDPATPDWREISLFLWKARSNQVHELSQRGTWDHALQLATTTHTGTGEVPVINPVSTQLFSTLLDRLMPESAHSLSLEVLVVILVIFVVCVGPVDYFVLGRFHRRKLTWLLFPLVTFAITGSTVWLSNRSMQVGNSRRSAVVYDIVDDGRPARVNQFELLFANSRHTAETDVQHGLLTTLEAQMLSIRSNASPRGAQYSEPFEMPLVAPAVYTGWTPARYRITQDLPQWTPQMNRVLQIAPTEQPAGQLTGFNWSAFRAQELRSQQGKARLVQAVISQFGTDASALLMHGETQEQLTPGTAAAARVLGSIGSVSKLAKSGVFSFLSRISPAGGTDVADLALLDDSDPREWLLLLAVPAGDDFHIYRKLYRETP